MELVIVAYEVASVSDRQVKLILNFVYANGVTNVFNSGQ